MSILGSNSPPCRSRTLGTRFLVLGLAAALASGALSFPSLADPETGLDTPIPVAHGTFLATASGPGAPHRLPATLGLEPDKRTFSAAEFVGDRLSGGIVLFARQRFALSYRHFDNRGTPSFDEDEYTLLLGGGDGVRAAASEVRWMRNDLGGRPDALSFGFSVGFRPDPHFALAYRGEHMNRPHYLDGRLDDAHTVSVALSPIDRLALATDVIFREDGGDDFRLRYGFELEPYPGIRLGAALDNESVFTAAMSYAFGAEEAGYGVHGSLDGGDPRHAAYVGHQEGRKPDPHRPPSPPKPPKPPRHP
jgi:hypothetical protein